MRDHSLHSHAHTRTHSPHTKVVRSAGCWGNESNERGMPLNLAMVVFFFRWLRGGDQATEDHHHRQAAGDPQKCLQELAKAGTPRPRAAVLRDGAGHESCAGRQIHFWGIPVILAWNKIQQRTHSVQNCFKSMNKTVCWGSDHRESYFSFVFIIVNTS